MKYVIDINGEAILSDRVGTAYREIKFVDGTWDLIPNSFVERLEPLNSDYINEHFGELQDEAHQVGMNDAWAAARFLLRDANANLICGMSAYSAIMELSPAEAIKKIEGYKKRKKAEQEIKVGDEVKAKWGVLGVVTKAASGWCNVAWSDGDTGYYLCENVTKTGRSYTQIADIMEAMKGGEE